MLKLHVVEEPVHLGGPAVTVGAVELVLEILQGPLLHLLHRQGLADIAYVIQRLELWDAALEHHGEQSDDQVGMLAQNQVGLAAQFLEAEGHMA